jgi:hypothetical protein
LVGPKFLEGLNPFGAKKFLGRIFFIIFFISVFLQFLVRAAGGDFVRQGGG